MQVCLCVSGNTHVSPISVCSLNKLLQWVAVINKLSFKCHFLVEQSLFFFFPSITHRCYSGFSRDGCLEPKETGASTLLAASELCPQPRWLSWSFTSLLLWPRRLPLCWRQTGRHRATLGVPGQAATDTGQVWTSSPSPQYAAILKRLDRFRSEQRTAPSWLGTHLQLWEEFSMSLKCLRGFRPAGKFHL